MIHRLFQNRFLLIFLLFLSTRPSFSPLVPLLEQGPLHSSLPKLFRETDRGESEGDMGFRVWPVQAGRLFSLQ